jgi:hypothetical protein
MAAIAQVASPMKRKIDPAAMSTIWPRNVVATSPVRQVPPEHV